LAGWAPRQVSPLGLRPRERMTTGRRRTRHGAMGSPHAAGGIRTPFPTLSPRGSPRGPFPRRPTSSPESPRVWSAVEGGCPLQRRVWCRASQDFPRHAAHPAEGGGGGLPSSRPAPAPPGKWVCPHPTAPAPPGQGPAPKGTSIRPVPLLFIACKKGLLQAHPIPGASPDNRGLDPSPPRLSPQATSPRSTPLER